MKSSHTIGDYIGWTVNGALLFLIGYGVYVVLAGPDTPVNMKLWHTFAHYCYRRAYRWGQLGIAAEHAYWTAVEKARP